MHAITQYRQARGWSQRELARRCGMHPATVSLIERGRRTGNLATYRRIAAALQVSLSDIFAAESESSPRLTLADVLEPVGGIDGVPELPVGNWSPTRLADWLSCPAKGAWSCGVWELPADFAYPKSEAALRGRATHKYAETRLQGGSVDDALIAAADETVGLNPDTWRPYVEAWEDQIQPTIGAPEAIEQRLEVAIAGHRVTAVIDVVDEAGTIRDFKTGEHTPNPISVIRENLQGPMYVAAWRDVTGDTRPFQLDYIIGLKRGTKTASILVPVTPVDLDRVARQLDWAGEQAAHPDRIVPNPINKFGCGTCAFATICHERFGTYIPAPAETAAAS